MAPFRYVELSTKEKQMSIVPAQVWFPNGANQAAAGYQVIGPRGF